MALRRILHLTGLTLGAAFPLAAQQPMVGTIVFGTHVTVPDSMRAKLPVGDSVDIQLTVMSDGHRYAADIATGPMGPMQAMHAHFVFAPTKDTLHLGLILPPELAAMVGGAPGFRVDVPTSMLDSISHMAKGAFDSISKKLPDSIRKSIAVPEVKYRSLGTSATVGGLRCERWQTTTVADTAEICVIPTPALIHTWQESFKKMLGTQEFSGQFTAIMDAAKQAFGGRDMTAIRMVMPRLGIRMELLSSSDKMPDAAQFDLPATLQLIPIPGLPKKPAGGSTRQQ